MLFRVNHTIPASGGDDVHKPGEVKPGHKFSGCDIAWLVQVGALSPVGGNKITALVGDDPSQDQLLSEIGRLQSNLEQFEVMTAELRRENDRLGIELARVPQQRPSGPPEGDLLAVLGIHPGESESQESALAREIQGFKGRAEQAERDRDAARARADQYAERLGDLERAAGTAHPHPTTPDPGSVTRPIPMPDPPAAVPVIEARPDPRKGRR